MAAESSKRIEDFLEIVRSPSLPVNTQQLIAAHELVMELQKRGEWPADIGKSASLLAPVLCSSAHEQEEFHRRFKEWLSATASPQAPPDWKTQTKTLELSNEEHHGWRISDKR